MALTLTSLCAVDTCGHPYNWHIDVGSFKCRVTDCRCLEFMEKVVTTEQFDEIRARHLRAVAEDGKANPNRVTVESREEIRNALDNSNPWGGEPGIPVKFETKDSGQRAEFDSGMVRDTDAGKARFELLLPLGVPYDAQFLVRVAELLGRGAEKYDNRNWEKAQGDEEMERFKSSALRHLMQWAAGETDEDHAAAVVFNLLGYETTKWKRDHGLLRPEG